ncbi:MAG: hypothetical protein ACRDUV_14710 [Pseudonocardiaceae bacterium]
MSGHIPMRASARPGTRNSADDATVAPLGGDLGPAADGFDLKAATVAGEPIRVARSSSSRIEIDPTL